MNWFPCISLTVACILLIVVRSCRHRLQYGRYGISYTVEETIALVVMLSSMLMQAIMFAQDRHYFFVEYLIPFICGALLFVLSVVAVWYAQGHLGSAWRSSIDQQSKPGLHTQGIYRYCRNPIILGMVGAMTGYMLMIPTSLSLVLWICTVVALRVQIIREERWLFRTYGMAYLQYKHSTGRYCPRISSLWREAARD